MYIHTYIYIYVYMCVYLSLSLSIYIYIYIYSCSGHPLAVCFPCSQRTQVCTSPHTESTCTSTQYECTLIRNHLMYRCRVFNTSYFISIARLKRCSVYAVRVGQVARQGNALIRGGRTPNRSSEHPKPQCRIVFYSVRYML